MQIRCVVPPLKPNAMFKKTTKKSLFPKHAVGADAIVQLCQTSAVHRHCLMQQSSETFGRKWNNSAMTKYEADRHVCEFVLMPNNVFLLWTGKKWERERETEASRLGEGGRGKSPRSARRRARAALNVGMFRYLLKRLHMGKKEKSSSMLWLQPAGAKGLASVWHKQTLAGFHTHTLTHTYIYD